MLLFLLLLCTLAVSPSASAAGIDRPPESRAGAVRPAEDLNAAWTAILQEIVTDGGRVRYDHLRGPLRQPFLRVLKAVETFDLDRLRTFEERLAFWLNAYNVQMLASVMEAPEVRRIVGEGYDEMFFRTPFLTASRGLTLDEIEHVVLRLGEGRPAVEALRLERLDPRIHVGLNCAALGCPPLQQSAFASDTVEAQLDRAMSAFVDSPQHFRATDGGFVFSALLDWFGSDFESTGLTAGDYLLSFMSPARPGYERLRTLLDGRTAAEIRQRPDVQFEYDWAVNSAHRPD